MIGLRTAFQGLTSNLAPAYVSTGGSRFVSARSGSIAQMQGTAAQLRTMGNTGIVHAIVSMFTQAVAESEWRLMRPGTDTEVLLHPAAKLWAKPNAYMHQSEFLKTAMQHYELAGETDWLLVKSDVLPGFEGAWELWPLRPDWLKPIPHPTQYLAGWIYQVPGREPVPYKVDEIIQHKRPNPSDPYRGLSWVAAAAADIYGESAAADWQNTFFANDATPGGVVEFPERLNDEEFSEFVDRWRDTHQGTQNAHKIAILEGAKFVPTPVSMRDMQFEELRKLMREFTRQASGFPRPLLGDTENVNKAAAIAGEYMFVRWHVRPRLSDLKDTLNNKLLPNFANTRAVEFQFETPVPADKELEIMDRDSLYLNVGTLVRAGFDPAASLEALGLPPIEHLGLPPVTVQPEDEPAVGGDAVPDGFARPGAAEDAQARATWERAVAMKEGTPSLSWEAIADFVGVSDRTLRRYRGEFEGI